MNEALNSLPKSILSSHWHFFHAQGGLDLGVGDHVVLGEFLHALRVQGQVKHVTNLGKAVHQAAGDAPDMRLLAQGTAYHLYQFVGG